MKSGYRPSRASPTSSAIRVAFYRRNWSGARRITSASCVTPRVKFAEEEGAGGGRVRGRQKSVSRSDISFKYRGFVRSFVTFISIEYLLMQCSGSGGNRSPGTKDEIQTRSLPFQPYPSTLFQNTAAFAGAELLLSFRLFPTPYLHIHLEPTQLE
jgi:hypothetical protein